MLSGSQHQNVEEISEDQLKDCVKGRSHIDPSDYDLAQIEKGIAHVKLENSSSRLEMRVWELDLQYSKALKEMGYSEFIQKKSEIAVKQIIRRISHKQLKKRVLLTYKLRKKELESDYGKFMREVAREGAAIDRQEAASLYDKKSMETDSENEDVSERKRKRSKNKKSKRDRPSDDERGSKDTTSSKRQKPDCLNPKCTGKHLLRDCPNTTKEEALSLFKKYKEARGNKNKANANGNVGLVEQSVRTTNLFRATLCSGAVEVIAKADQGSDINVLSPSVLLQMKKADPNLKVESLGKDQCSMSTALH